MKLDTSGRVECDASFQPLGWAIWTDLSPFTQGYVEALLVDFDHSKGVRDPLLPRAFFRNLAPETLARIIADCEAFQGTRAFDDLVSSVAALAPEELQNAGAEFYHVRQRMEDRCHGFRANDWPQFRAEPLNVAARAFPPLTVRLGDDGKVRFA